MDSVLCPIDERLISHARAVVESLKQHRQTVITSESCTAGLIAAALSYGAEASTCLHGGFVVYSKAQKTTALGVSAELLRECGSVNGEVASQLAIGALQRSPAHLALAVTGVVGPHPDEDGAQPGHAFLAIARAGQATLVKEEHVPLADPDEVRRALIERALAWLSAAAAHP